MAHQGPGHRVQITTTTTQRPAPTGVITTQGVILGHVPVSPNVQVSPVPTGVVITSGTPLPVVAPTTSPLPGRGVFLSSNPHDSGVQKGPAFHKTTVVTQKTVKAQMSPGYANHVSSQPSLQVLATPTSGVPKPSVVVVSSASTQDQGTVVQVKNTGGQVSSVTVTKFRK